jgi:hypothetical protein
MVTAETSIDAGALGVTVVPGPPGVVVADAKTEVVVEPGPAMKVEGAEIGDSGS